MAPISQNLDLESQMNVNHGPALKDNVTVAKVTEFLKAALVSTMNVHNTGPALLSVFTQSKHSPEKKQKPCSRSGQRDEQSLG